MVRNVFVCVFVYTETKKKEKESSIQCIVITSENIENFHSLKQNTLVTQKFLQTVPGLQLYF